MGNDLFTSPVRPSMIPSADTLASFITQCRGREDQALEPCEGHSKASEERDQTLV